MKKNQIIIVAVIVIAVIIGAVVLGSGKGKDKVEDYPTRPIELIVPYGAGGGTDVWNRTLAAEMQETLGENITVSNMTGGTGAVATDYVLKAEHDGYRILGTSETNLPIPVMAGVKTTAKDWDYFICAGSPGVVCVHADSPYKTIDDLIEAAKAKPDTIKAATTSSGLWFIQATILNTAGDMPIGYSPYDGSRPAILACVSKETDLVVASAGEVNEFVKAGTLRPLAVMKKEAYDFPTVGEIPAITDSLPGVSDYLPLDQWIGFSVPSDTPKEVKDALTKAFNEAMKSDTVKNMADEQLSTLFGLSGEEADSMAEAMQSKMCYLLKDMELTQYDPKEMGVPEP
ncbi:MAG: tripartite tricarboxylate transporter substrate binding protein [Clostridiaceae bacterium]